MKLWTLILKKDEPADFTFIEREKPNDSWFYNTAFDTTANRIPADKPSIRPIIIAAEKICNELKLFPEEVPECCVKESIMIRRGYETLVCIARTEAFEVMVEKGIARIRTKRHFFSIEEMKKILEFIDVVIKQGWF